MNKLAIPLFPLHTVLFPGGPLDLRIFEPRYLDMVSRCLREESGFGVILIKEGREAGSAVTTYNVGTLGKISDWNRRPGGLLGITVMGEQRFRLISTEVQQDRLLQAEVELIPNESVRPLRRCYQGLANLLQEIMGHLDHPYIKLSKHYDDAAWVGARLVELLPFRLEQKQYLLQLSDADERLELLQAMLSEMS